MNARNKIPAAIIIVSYNTCDLTRDALKALYLSSVLPNQIIVVDNASTDGSIGMVKKEFPEVILIENKQNLGFAKANNLAIKEYVKEPFIWLLNSDTKAGNKTLEQLYDFMVNNPKIGAVEPSLVYPDGSNQSVGGYFPGILNTLLYLLPFTYFAPFGIKKRLKTIAFLPQPISDVGVKLDYLTGAALFLRKEVLDKAGLLGEEYFMYFEETDLCWRIKRAGFDVVAIKTEPVMHIYGGSYKSKTDPERLKIFLQSLSLFVRKNYSGVKKYFILGEVYLFGKLSIFIKGLKK